MKLTDRLARLEAQRDETVPIRGVSGVLLAYIQARRDRLARDRAADDDAPPPPWAVSIRAAMDRHRQEQRT